MNNVNLNKFTFLAIFAFFALTVTSCVEDDVSGCTDPAAENYNINAIVDSGNCTYAADALVGTYNGTTEGVSGSLLNADRYNSSAFMFSVAKSTIGGENDVELSLYFDAVPMVFQGSVSGNTLTIDDQMIGLDYPDTGAPTSSIVDVQANGIATFIDGDNALECMELTLMVVSQTGGTKDSGSCMFFGTK